MLYEDSGMVFEYGFDSDAASSYLVVRLADDVELLKYQVEIICRNPNTAFVPFHIRRENEAAFIYYSITSKISLSEYLERKRLNRKELLDLLKNITKNLLLYGNYLLELSGFVIHRDFVYINPATAEVSLIYIPVSCSRNTAEVYRDFLKDLVVNSANVDDNARDNYLQRILNYLKSDSFCLIDFNRLITDLRNSGEVYEPPVKAAWDNAEKPQKEEAAASVGKSYGRLVLVQLLTVLAAAIICLLLVSHGKAEPLTIAGILLIAAALDILAVKKTAGKPVRSALQEDKTAKQKAFAQRGKTRRDTAAPDILKSYDTVMLSEAPADSRPYLEGTGARGGERIVIDKDKFVIGRLGSMVDHMIQGSTVGKLHAEITGSDGGYCIRDLNSKNGTYVNDVRIGCNKEWELRNNDRVRFSNYEYIFRLQQPD